MSPSDRYAREFSLELLDIATDAITECEDIKSFTEWVGERTVPTLAGGMYVMAGGIENTVGDIPSGLNIYGMKDELGITRELGNTVVTIPIPPDGKLVLYDTVTDKIEEERLDNVGDTIAEILPRLRENKMKAQRQDFMLLHNVAVEMVKAESMGEVFEFSMNAVDSMINADYSRIDFWQGDGFKKYTTTVVGKQLDELPSVDSAPEYAYKQNKRVLIQHNTDYESETGVDDEYGSIIIAPIEGVGVYMAVKKEADAFEVYQADIARIMMSYAAQIVRANDARQEIKEANVELQEQKERLAVLNRIIRHDIHNEMQYVLGMAGVLHDEVSEDQRQYIDGIESSARTVADLTETMRNLVEGALHDNGTGTRLTPLNESLRPEVENIIEGADDVSVEYDPPENEIEVVADGMLDSVFRNLLTNAINHNDKEKAEIKISHEIASGAVTISIADNGPGISEDIKDKLFAKGMKGNDSSGTGMGMFLIKTLLSKYNGSIEVEDNDPEGTIFHITLQRHNE